MDTRVDRTFFTFSQPRFKAVSDGLFKGVKESYGLNVIEAVTAFAEDYGDEGVKLVNLMLPELRKV